MSETDRSRETGSDTGTGLPQRRTGHAFAHTPLRSDGRPPQTPRGARQPDPAGRPGTTPPVP
ncbi:phosphoesterase, partial [Streptomyces sp. NPDC059981]